MLAVWPSVAGTWMTVGEISLQHWWSGEVYRQIHFDPEEADSLGMLQLEIWQMMMNSSIRRGASSQLLLINQYSRSHRTTLQHLQTTSLSSRIRIILNFLPPSKPSKCNSPLPTSSLSCRSWPLSQPPLHWPVSPHSLDSRRGSELTTDSFNYSTCCTIRYPRAMPLCQRRRLLPRHGLRVRNCASLRFQLPGCL